MADSLDSLQRLIDVVARLRDRDRGCPWDLAQTPETLIPYILEEAYETVDAIRQGDPTAIAEELGDLLLQVVLQAQIASETGAFDLGAIANGITDKLIRRHPHVFSDGTATTPEAVSETWEAIKAAEKGHDPNDRHRLSRQCDRDARSLPPLMATAKLSKRAAAVGFEWETLDGVWEKFHEELDELRDAIATGDPDHQEAELGDLLFSLVQIARWQNLDPTAALHKTNRKFIARLALMESLGDRPLQDYTLAELDELWTRAKATIRAEVAARQGNTAAS
ncbi:MAG: nucleoside triphosphate pyrophosphohydrolase [Cyanobacteria bacterium]|nr:nucleoside triphosphate pyrophosphohydrolase [Cyanobacteriota bacterium]